jgi:hypothetical protein
MGCFPGEKNGQDVKLTAHLHPEQGLRMAEL